MIGSEKEGAVMLLQKVWMSLERCIGALSDGGKPGEVDCRALGQWLCSSWSISWRLAVELRAIFLPPFDLYVKASLPCIMGSVKLIVISCCVKVVVVIIVKDI